MPTSACRSTATMLPRSRVRNVDPAGDLRFSPMLRLNLGVFVGLKRLFGDQPWTKKFQLRLDVSNVTDAHQKSAGRHEDAEPLPARLSRSRRANGNADPAKGHSSAPELRAAGLPYLRPSDADTAPDHGADSENINQLLNLSPRARHRRHDRSDCHPGEMCDEEPAACFLCRRARPCRHARIRGYRLRCAGRLGARLYRTETQTIST